MTSTDITTTKALNKAELTEIAERIRIRIRRTITDIIETGRDLTEAKAQLEHGHFIDWLWNEFSMSARTAQNYMRAAEWAEGKNEIVSHLSPTAVYALAAPSAPTSVTDRVIADAKAGLPVSDEYVKRHIKAAIEEERERKAHQREAPVRAVLAAVSATAVDTPTEHEDSGRSVEELPPETTYAAEPERPLTKPRKPTKDQLERQKWKDERAKERNEVCDILRKLPRDDLFRLSDLHWCWMASDFEAAAEWLFVLAEIDPDHDWLGEIELSNLNTEENRQRLEQIKAASRNDANQHADLGAKVDQVVDDDPLVIPAIFRREKTA